MPTIAIALLVFMTVLGAGLLLMQPAFAQYSDAYAVRVRPRKVKEEIETQPHQSSVLMICQTVGQLVLATLPGLADQRTIQLLTHANCRSQAHLAIYIGIKALVAGAATVLALIGASTNLFLLLITPFTTLLGWLLPNFFLASRGRQRQSLIINEMPTIIDLLIVCAQAGLGLMLAVDKVSKESEATCPILCIELKEMIQDVKIFAKSVPVAMREMGERCGVDELVSMASALIAAEQKGADISYPLKQQSQALRERLKRKKEEEAAKVPVKMVPVIMLFVMPLILAPMLGPAVVTIIYALTPMMAGGLAGGS